jgi:hypothetical protein
MPVDGMEQYSEIAAEKHKNDTFSTEVIDSDQSCESSCEFFLGVEACTAYGVVGYQSLGHSRVRASTTLSYF